MNLAEIHVNRFLSLVFLIKLESNRRFNGHFLLHDCLCFCWILARLATLSNRSSAISTLLRLVLNVDPFLFPFSLSLSFVFYRIQLFSLSEKQTPNSMFNYHRSLSWYFFFQYSFLTVCSFLVVVIRKKNDSIFIKKNRSSIMLFWLIKTSKNQRAKNDKIHLQISPWNTKKKRHR